MSENNTGQLATVIKLYRRLVGRGKPTAEEPAGLDFLPVGYADRRRRRRADAILLTLLVVVVATIGVTWHLAERSLHEAEAAFNAVDAEYAQAAQRIEQVRRMRLDQKTVADRMELTASLLEKLPRSNLLADLTNRLPEGVSLTDCGLEAKRRLPPPPAKGQTLADLPPAPLAYDTTLTLTGVARTEGQVSDYVAGLSRSGYYGGVDLRWVSLDRPRDGEPALRRFMVLLAVDAEADARSEMTPAAVATLD